jgi:hypothetical protein
VSLLFDWTMETNKKQTRYFTFTLSESVIGLNNKQDTFTFTVSESVICLDNKQETLSFTLSESLI